MHRNIVPFVPYDFKGELVPCPVCGSPAHRPVARMDRRLKPLSTVICDDCGVFYSNPMPTRDELTHYYKNEYRKDYQFAFTKPSSKHVEKKRIEARSRYEVVRKETTGERLVLLDFGCGSGELVHEFATRGHEAHGFEPGATYASFAQTAQTLDIKIQSADFRSASYEPKRFDAITMLHVLEHIPDPIAALEKAHEWLKDDGVLYLEVPNMQGYSLKCFEHFHFAHVLGFSRDNLILALRRAGFRVRREMSKTSIIAEKAIGTACTAAIDPKATAARNHAEYTQGVSMLAYVRYHLRRGYRRLLSN